MGGYEANIRGRVVRAVTPVISDEYDTGATGLTTLFHPE
jgi:hypothetical protein